VVKKENSFFCFQTPTFSEFESPRAEVEVTMDFATGGIQSGGFYGAGLAGGRFDREKLKFSSKESSLESFRLSF
jgi:hypothetical protein